MDAQNRLTTPADRPDYLRTNDDLFDSIAAEIATGIEGFRTVPDLRHKTAAEEALAHLEDWLQPLLAQVWHDGQDAAARGDTTCPYRPGK